MVGHAEVKRRFSEFDGEYVHKPDKNTRQVYDGRSAASNDIRDVERAVDQIVVTGDGRDKRAYPPSIHTSSEREGRAHRRRHRQRRNRGETI